jgi:hypothetical protein
MGPRQPPARTLQMQQDPRHPHTQPSTPTHSQQEPTTKSIALAKPRLVKEKTGQKKEKSREKIRNSFFKPPVPDSAVPTFPPRGCGSPRGVVGGPGDTHQLTFRIWVIPGGFGSKPLLSLGVVSGRKFWGLFTGVLMFCTGCGTRGAEGAAFCGTCGASLGGEVVVREPIVIDGRTYKPGSGPYEGLYSAGRGWVRIENGRVVKASGVAGSGGQRSTGRTIGGIICVLVALYAGWTGVNAFIGFSDLEAEGNTFAGALVLVGLGAFVVAAAFGVWGLVLLSRK